MVNFYMHSLYINVMQNLNGQFLYARPLNSSGLIFYIFLV